MSWEIYSLLVLAGAIGGFVSGLIGIGGGIIYVFVIPYALPYFNIPAQWQAQFIIANSLAAILLGSLIANYVHYKKGFFFPRPVLLIGVSAMISSWLSLKYIVNTSCFSMEVFLAFLIVLMGYMLIYTLKGARMESDLEISSLPVWGLLLTGLLAGMIASASGLGGGIAVIPVLNRFFGVNIKKASAISLGVIMVSSFTMCIVNGMVDIDLASWNVGLLLPAVFISLSIAVVLTAPIGVMWAHKLTTRTISYIYAGILTVVMSTKLATFIQLLNE